MPINRMRKGLIFGISMFAVQGVIAGVSGQGASLYAQGSGTSARVDSTQYLKAEALVNNGDAAEGRAMVDSLLAATKVGTPQYVEGLYWRAKLASSAEQAQKDYLRVIIEYSESSRVPDALLNLGQLEFVRGDRDKALRHFERLRKDYPGHVLQASAGYWVARTLLDGNDLQRGCTINAEALSQVKPGNVELKNRIEFQNQRCRGVQLASADSGAGNDVGNTPVPAKDVAANTKSAPGKTVPVKGDEKPAAKDVAEDETDSASADQNATDVAMDADTPVSETSSKTSTRPASTKGATATKAATAVAKDTATKAAASSERYAVQIAAFKTKPQANTLVESLRKKGYTARVDGTSAPFRVKIGRFVSRSGAEALLAELRARNIDGFITKG